MSLETGTYVDLHFDIEKIRLTILTNICRMLITREYMSLEKYQKPSKERSNVEKPSENDKINNALFLPFIEKRSDNGIYMIPLDKPYPDQRSKDGESADFNGTQVVVKIIPQVLKDIGNSPMLNEFFGSYQNYHKIIVFDAVSDKVYNILSRKKNVEVFDRNDLMIDLMSHVCAPLHCNFVTIDDISHIINPKFPKILENDPLVRYHNGKKGQIMRIVRPSLNNSIDVVYRKVIDPKPVFKK